MNYEAFNQLLRDQEEYDTPSTARAALTHLPGMPSPCFYAGMVWEVLTCSTSIALGRFDLRRWGRASWGVMRSCERAGGRFEVRGLHHLNETDGAAVFISNHMSVLETMVFPCLILPFKPCAFIIKESLLKYPLFGRINENVDSIPVTRSNPRVDLERVMTEGGRLLSSGKSMIIFPQSTRTLAFTPAKFGTLGVKLAKKAGVQVIPVAIKTDMVKNGRFLKDFGPVDPDKTIHIEFGAPMTVTGNGRDQHEEIIRYISERVTGWGGTVDTGSGEPAAQ